MTDLWPSDIAPSTPNVKPPVTLLREQAALLGAKTKNIVEAQVVPADTQYHHGFGYEFQLVGPALNNYRFPLFRIEYSIEMYPLWMYVAGGILGLDEGTAQFNVPSEADLLEALAKVFAAEKTRQVIQAIQAQSMVAA
jgi:hypothetical protein